MPGVLVTLTITASARLDKPVMLAVAETPTSEPEMRRERRRVHLPELREAREIVVYDDARVTPGSTLAGPAIVDADDTTIYLPSGCTAVRDEHLSYVISTAEAT